MRFVVDESTWSMAGVSEDQRLQMFEDFLELISWIQDPRRGLTSGMDSSKEAGPVWRSREIYDVPVEPGRPLYDYLFAAPPPAWRDLIRRVIIQLDRMPDWEESFPCEVLDVEIAGKTLLAPSVALAWSRLGRNEAAACLALGQHRGRGPVPVTVNGVARTVHFIVLPIDFRDFFRELIVVENVGPQTFPDLAPAAFPDLEWVDGVWQGLRTKKNSFFGPRRPTLMQHLAALNDDGARIFQECAGGQGVAQRFSGISLSSENGNARRYKPSIEARKVIHRGAPHVFWWHTKITYDDGRIHFLHFPPRPPNPERPTAPRDPPEGVIAIGIFNDHCVLP